MLSLTYLPLAAILVENVIHYVWRSLLISYDQFCNNEQSQIQYLQESPCSSPFILINIYFEWLISGVFQIIPSLAAKEMLVRCSSVISCIVMKDDGVHFQQVLFCAECWLNLLKKFLHIFVKKYISLDSTQIQIYLAIQIFSCLCTLSYYPLLQGSI